MSTSNYELLELYGERFPYVDINSFGGVKTIFNKSFIFCVDKAFSDDCLVGMGTREVDLFTKFINFEDNINSDEYCQKLDEWLCNIVNDVENASLEGC